MCMIISIFIGICWQDVLAGLSSTCALWQNCGEGGMAHGRERQG